MPNRTIYVSDGDLPLYQKAQELAGGKLSAAITTALRRYVEVESARQDGYEEVVVKVGRGTGRKVRFMGVLLGEWGRSSEGSAEVYRIYRTPAGRFAVHRDKAPTGYWKGGASSDGSPTGGWRDYLGYIGVGGQTWAFVEGEATLDVTDSLDELREKLPAEFSAYLSDIDIEPTVDDWDI